jgi:hydrogenase maturation protein HypF
MSATLPARRKARIHILGIVQGVGFRPFIYSLAHRHTLAGWVKNTSAGVEIEVEGPPATLAEFVAAIRAELPPLARIDSLEVVHAAAQGMSGFMILESEAIPGAFQPISPDVGLCPDCLAEMYTPSDRRYVYPFINCTNCGPRFTIIADIPYDRPNTTMAPFPMCPDCRREYDDPLDRRFHAQPVACPRCGPGVWLEVPAEQGTGSARRVVNGDTPALLEARRLLRAGRILAVKGLGGFHLACDATNPQAVAELRRRKLRVDKPFAIMFPDLESVRQHCHFSSAEQALLESRMRPIVILERLPGSGIVVQVAPLQAHLGCMLPYTPLHVLLFDHPLDSDHPGKLPPLVMTSGNLSEEPIATGNQEALERLASLADAFLLHNREIHVRCDDSVVRSLQEQGYPIRRSRGYAPDGIRLPLKLPPALAVGPEQKNTFCLTRDRYAFLSHHIGDMENYETLRSFEDGIRHFEHVFKVRPEAIARDLHPGYLSTRYALERGERENLPVIAVQHHHAHIAACMADNGLDGSRPVIGLSFDGTGYGEDGAIWGGEFLVADYRSFTRPVHLPYFPLPGGDQAIRRPARIALALLWSLGMEWEEWIPAVQELCVEERQALRVQLEKNLNTVKTSSMGRLFDAVSSLAGIRQKVNYEAQAAIELEAVLDPAEAGAYPFRFENGKVDLTDAIRALLADVHAGTSQGILSARFHNGIAGLSGRVCAWLSRETGLRVVALSGGVWQNLSLLERTLRLLQEQDLTVHLHRQVPANDGGLSLGQAIIGTVRLNSEL